MKLISTTVLIAIFLFGGWALGRDMVAGPNLVTQLQSELNRLLNDEAFSANQGVNTEVKFRVTELCQLQLLELGTGDESLNRIIESKLQNVFLVVDQAALGRVFELTLYCTGPRGPASKVQEKKFYD